MDRMEPAYNRASVYNTLSYSSLDVLGLENMVTLPIGVLPILKKMQHFKIF
jgi:hypothetical protein